MDSKRRFEGAGAHNSGLPQAGNFRDIATLLLRKQTKLPGQVIGINYALEYGSDRIEIHNDAVRAGGRGIAARGRGRGESGGLCHRFA